MPRYEIFLFLPPLAALLALLGAPAQAASANGLEKIHTLVVIYAENRSFDNLYGLFPGADGIPGEPQRFPAPGRAPEEF